MLRLKRQHDFDYVFSKGKRAFAKSVCMIYVSKTTQTLIGISVSKKHGNAVTRNKIKRLIRASYYPLADKLVKGYHIVFVPKVAESYSYDVFSRDIRYLLNKESILNKGDE